MNGFRYSRQAGACRLVEVIRRAVEWMLPFSPQALAILADWIAARTKKGD